MRDRERGFAAVWVIAALAISTLVGAGVYVVMKERRLDAEADEAEAAKHRPPPDAAVTEPEPTPSRVDSDDVAQPVPPEPSPDPTVPTDPAEADAVDPPPGDGLQFGTPGVAGELDKDAIVLAVRAGRPRIDRCISDHMATGASADGTLRVTLLVNRRGGVTDASAVGIDDDLGKCIAAAMKEVRFPRVKDGGTAKIVVPMSYRAPEEQGLQPVAEGDAPCDEVSCVLDNYEPACCQKFRRPATLADSPTRDELATALTKLKVKVATCAAQENITGTLTVRFKILPNGSTGSYVIAQAPPRVGACIVRAFSAYAWPHSVNGVSTSFPYNIQ